MEGRPTMTTEQDLEIIRLNLRLNVLRGVIGNILVALSRLHPAIGPVFAEGWRSQLENLTEVPLTGVSAVQSDLLASERREAIEETLSYLQSVLKQ